MHTRWAFVPQEGNRYVPVPTSAAVSAHALSLLPTCQCPAGLLGAAAAGQVPAAAAELQCMAIQATAAHRESGTQKALVFLAHPALMGCCAGKQILQDRSLSLFCCYYSNAWTNGSARKES